jgi:hypothetical protein
MGQEEMGMGILEVEAIYDNGVLHLPLYTHRSLKMYEVNELYMSWGR